MNLNATAPALAAASPVDQWQRPSPPDFGSILQVVAEQFLARVGYADPYTVADQQRVASAAMSGARTGEEVVTAARAVKDAFPARPGYTDPYTVANQIDVVTAALAGWYELDSMADRLRSIKQAMPARPGYADPYQPQQQIDMAISIYGGRGPIDRTPLPPINA
jgi:hypothetical protein